MWDGRSHRRRPQGGHHLSRIAASRHAMLERSQGGCENPHCPDPRYPSALSRNGFLHVVSGSHRRSGQGGADLLKAMIALCPNCHALKTRGTVTDEFRALLRATALAKHQELLAAAR